MPKSSAHISRKHCISTTETSRFWKIFAIYSEKRTKNKYEGVLISP